MSRWGRLPDDLMSSRSTTPAAKVVYVALAMYASDDGVAWPAVTTLASATGISHRQVQRLLRDLEQAGWIRREATARSNHYVLTPDTGDRGDTGDPCNARPRPMTSAVRTHDTGDRGDTGDPCHARPRPMTPRTSTHDTQDVDPCHRCHPTRSRLDQRLDQDQILSPPATQSSERGKKVKKPRPSGKTREPKRETKETAHPEHAQFVAHFDGLYRQHTGAKPTWGPKQGRWVKDLLARHGLDECKRRAEILFLAPPKWLANGGRDLGTLVNHFDKLAKAAQSQERYLRVDEKTKYPAGEIKL